MRKLYNTNREAEISSVVQDDISGMESLNFFFERGGKYYVPFADGSAGSWNMVETTGKDFVLTDGIPGVSVAGSGKAKSDTFEITDSSADISFIRAGGIIKIDGSYYNIKSVSDSTVTFDGTLAQNVESAIFPYALSVNYKTTTSESSAWSEDGTYSVGNDDGDGLVETVTKSGAKWTCTASLLSDSIADGTIVLHAVAIDAAGNVSSDVTTRTMISNHAPRLAKVHLATDLNGDGSYSSNEIEEFSALDDNGKSQEVVTLATDIYDFNSKIPDNTNKKTNAKAYFKVTGDLVVAPEFVGGHEGQGRVYYDAVIGSKSEPTWKLSESLHGELDNSNNKVADITAGTTDDRNNVLKYLTLSSTDMVAHFDREDKTDTIALSFWDSSEVYGFTGDKNSGYKADGNKIADGTASKLADSSSTLYSNFGYQWTVANIPVYFDITDDVAPTGTITPFYWNSLSDNSLYENSKEKGHIEFEETPSVSGTVVFRGNATDDQLLKSLTFAFDNGKTATSDYTAATASWTSVGTLATDGYEFNVKNTMLAQSGHSATWTLTVDSAKLLANGSNSLSVTAKQAKSATNASNNKSTAGDVQTLENAKTGYYSMNVVPYITGIARSATKNSNTTMNRSTYGEYPVAVGDTLTISGWNFGTSPTVNVGSEVMTVTNVNEEGTSFTINAPENSGELTVTVKGIVSLNNKNNNASESNLDSDGKFDNRYIRVWDVGHYFSNSDGGNEPTMAADNSGNLFSTWTLMGTGSVQMQRGLSSVNQPIYIGYDQPDKETALAVDKSNVSGDISVLFYPANVGSSGTPDSTCYADAMTVGGVWGLNLKNDFSNSSNYKYTVSGNNKYLSIAGNPYYKLDSKINTSGYQLASGSMRREVSQFQNGHTVRYGDNMHYVYYDSYNKSLRYTFQKAGYKISSKTPLTETGTYSSLSSNATGTADRKDIVGWILIDGKSDEQDRIHRWTDNDLENIWSNNDGGVSSFAGSGGKLGKDGKSVYINYNCSGAKALALAYTDVSGVYKVDLHTVSSISSDGKTLYWTDHEFPNYMSINENGEKEKIYYTPTGLCVYHGSSNVVKEGVAQITNSAEGKYSSIDVTSTGKPVIVYYDSANDKLRIAYASVSEINMYSSSEGCGKFTRQAISVVSGGTYVQAKIDGDNYLHIMYRDSGGKLCYLKSTNNPDGGAYTFDKPMTIDSSGTYGTLSVMNVNGSYVPCVSWLNSEGTANGVKYALLRKVDTGNGNTESLWDVQIVPAVVDGGNHYVSGGELVYVEGKSGSWDAEEDNVSMADCDAVVGFNTGRMDVVFLKSEK